MYFLIWLIASFLGRSWRIQINDPYNNDLFNDQQKKRIYCFWHAHLLVMAYTFRHTGKTAMVSASKDGRIAASVIHKWGYRVITGSSSRGGSSAFRESLRLLNNKKTIAITPDGPRGPKMKAKDGVAQIAQQAGADVIAIQVKANRFWQLNSWDGFLIPKPFAHVTITIGPPLHPPSKPVTSTTVAHFIQQIENKLEKNDSMA